MKKILLLLAIVAAFSCKKTKEDPKPELIPNPITYEVTVYATDTLTFDFDVSSGYIFSVNGEYSDGKFNVKTIKGLKSVYGFTLVLRKGDQCTMSTAENANVQVVRQPGGIVPTVKSYSGSLYNYQFTAQ